MRGPPCRRSGPPGGVMAEPVVRVQDLSVRYRTRESTTYAVEHASFDLYPGKVLAVIGESGSGKSTAAMSILRLLSPDADYLSGQVWFDDKNLLAMDDKSLRTIRGRRISTIFQDPVAGLNPVI